MVDTNAIGAAHRPGCWNTLRRRHQLHSVRLCVEEATRTNKHGCALVEKTEAELAAELSLGQVDDIARAELRLAIGNRNDVDAGEAELLAYPHPPHPVFPCCSGQGRRVSWGMHARDIRQSLKNHRTGRATAAILRHAERHPLGSATDPSLALLTEKGKSAARALGGCLEGFSHLRLYHSPVQRCRQTAECLAEGAASLGLRVEMVGPRQRLGFVCTKNEAAAVSLYTEIGDAFVSRWLSGELPEGMMEDPVDTVGENLRELCAALEQPSSHGPRLDLHVSHDWNIMVMRELLTGVRHEESGWLGFLDGLCFQQGADRQLTVSYGEHVQSAPLPWPRFFRRKDARSAQGVQA